MVQIHYLADTLLPL